MKELAAFFVMLIALVAGAVAVATKYSPETAQYVAAGGFALALGILFMLGGNVRTAAKQAAKAIWGRW